MTQSAGVDRPAPHLLIVQVPNTQVLLISLVKQR